MARIVKEVHRKYRNLRLIDVGANIGDSVALVKSLVDIPILCIDGDPEYTYLLRENVLKFKNVYVENVMLGDKKHKIRAKVANSGGTSHIEASAGHIFTDTLENVLKGNKKFYTAKFLKIDTDGYDGFVLRGASPYLKKTKPVIFFEYNPYFLNRAKDNGLKILEMLRKLGYVYALVYDNTGEYLCSSKLTKYDLLRELNHYVERKTWSKYFDICVFAKSDLNLFTKINARELKNWN
jgi:FkbM family methyltransferase